MTRLGSGIRGSSRDIWESGKGKKNERERTGADAGKYERDYIGKIVGPKYA